MLGQVVPSWSKLTLSNKPISDPSKVAEALADFVQDSFSGSNNSKNFRNHKTNAETYPIDTTCNNYI